MTNRERAGRAERALQAYNVESHENYSIGDLICDLGHLARFRNLNPIGIYETGIGHFANEVADEPDGMKFYAEAKVTIKGLPRKELAMVRNAAAYSV